MRKKDTSESYQRPPKYSLTHFFSNVKAPTQEENQEKYSLLFSQENRMIDELEKPIKIDPVDYFRKNQRISKKADQMENNERSHSFNGSSESANLELNLSSKEYELMSFEEQPIKSEKNSDFQNFLQVNDNKNDMIEELLMTPEEDLELFQVGLDQIHNESSSGPNQRMEYPSLYSLSHSNQAEQPLNSVKCQSDSSCGLQIKEELTSNKNGYIIYCKKQQSVQIMKDSGVLVDSITEKDENSIKELCLLKSKIQKIRRIERILEIFGRSFQVLMNFHKLATQRRELNIILSTYQISLITENQKLKIEVQKILSEAIAKSKILSQKILRNIGVSVIIIKDKQDEIEIKQDEERMISEKFIGKSSQQLQKELKNTLNTNADENLEEKIKHRKEDRKKRSNLRSKKKIHYGEEDEQ